jgi:YcaO-like protein with predicted kinase domain
VAEITGLDRLQLPNYYAVRPLARHRCAIVSGGRGLNREAALLSALFECFERWAAEEYPGKLVSASLNSLKQECPGLKLAYPSDMPGDQALLWAFGFDLISGQSCLLPLKKVIFPFLPIEIGRDIEQITSTTNGLGAAAEPLEAICSGVLELIERDAVARLDPNNLALLDHATFPQPARELSRRFETNAVELAVVRCRAMTLVPVYYAIARDEPMGLAFFFCSGSAARANATDALLRSLTELSQSRAAYISTLRDDVGIRISAFDQVPYSDRRSDLDSWFSKSNVESFTSEGEFVSGSFREMLDVLIDRIAEAYSEPLLACAQLRSFPGLFAFRLYCPQMSELLAPTQP